MSAKASGGRVGTDRRETNASSDHGTSEGTASAKNADPFSDQIAWDDQDYYVHTSYRGQRIAEHYVYRGVDDEPLYVVGRTASKDFPQWRPDGTWGLKDVRRVLYRLPDVIDGIRAGATIHVAEGERDVHAITDAVDAEGLNVVATCFPGGGRGSPKSLDALDVLGKYGSAAEVVVWQDKDDTGRKRAANTIARLVGKVERIRLVEAAEGKDAADHLAAGHSLEEAVQLDLPEIDEEGHSGRERLDVVLNVLDQVAGGDDDQYEAVCPAHNDGDPSLSVGLGDDGYPVIECHAGCTDPEGWPEFRSILLDHGVPDWALRSRGSVDRSTPGYMLLSDVTPTVVRWLWPGRIPLGKLTILDGDPERGKSLITLDLAARVSSGMAMPDDTPGLDAPGGVILTCAEDDIEDTIAPRLLAHGADLDQIATIPLRRDEDSGEVVPLTFPEDLGRIRTAVRSLREEQGVAVRLVVIDPITAYLSESINSHSDASVRRATTPLTEVAQSVGAAVLMVRHLNKQGELKAAYRGGGSIAFTAAARSALIVDEHPDLPGTLVMARVKNNLAAPVPSLMYRVGSAVEYDAPRIEWQGMTDLDADALLHAKDGRHDAPEREEAERFLRDLLTDGDVPAKQVQGDAKDAGITRSTLNRAKAKLGVKAVRVRDEDGKTSGWVWRLPPPVEIDGVTVKYAVRGARKQSGVGDE